MRTIVFGLAFFSLAAAASAEDIHKLTKTAKAHKELRVQGHANFNGNICESRGPLPEIELNIPPKSGTVCMRPGMVRVQNIWAGPPNQHCIGTKVSGVFVIYISFGSFTGLDTMQYTVKGVQSATRTYEVEIRVEASEATAVTSSAPSEPQRAGPMLACPALVADAEITGSSPRHRRL